MMMRTVLATALLALAACTEKPQTAGDSRRDTEPFKGTGVASFTAPGWKPGDQGSWEQQLKTRAEQGQNDYVKVH